MGMYSSAWFFSVSVCSTSPMVRPFISFHVAALLCAEVSAAHTSSTDSASPKTGWAVASICLARMRMVWTSLRMRQGTACGKRRRKAESMCSNMIRSTHPTLLNITSGDTHERRNSPASRESVSPTSSSMDGVSVDWNLTKQ